MRRREFISLIGGVAATWPLAVQAQQRALPVVGLLRNTEIAAQFIAAFRRGLSDSGYTDGTNVIVDIRVAEGKDQLSELAADLVRKRVAAIVVNTDAAPFAISATRSIPIVFVIGSTDPVAVGFVPNLNHPSGNVTGVSFSNEGLVSKRLEILHELVPNAETVALLVDPEYMRAEAELRQLNLGGRALRQKVVVFKDNDREIDAAFTAIAQAKVGAMLVGAGAFLTSRRVQIIQSAALHKIPAIYPFRLHTEAGGLMSYGASQPDAYRRAGIYVARILKGEKPGDLPVELPTKFELVINLTTAKALGLDIPFHLQQRADDLIE
jgi:putative ABC transport system substrate-binding protein